MSFLIAVEWHLCDLQLPSAGNCAEPTLRCWMLPSWCEVEHPWDQGLLSSHAGHSSAVAQSHLNSKDLLASSVQGKRYCCSRLLKGKQDFSMALNCMIYWKLIFFFFFLDRY